MLNQADIAVLVIDGTEGFAKEDAAMLERIQKKGIPYVIVCNKIDEARREHRDYRGTGG